MNNMVSEEDFKELAKYFSDKGQELLKIQIEEYNKMIFKYKKEYLSNETVKNVLNDIMLLILSGKLINEEVE